MERADLSTHASDAVECSAEFWEAFRRARDSESQEQVIDRFFHRIRVATDQDVQDSRVYLVPAKNRSHLVIAFLSGERPDDVSLKAAFSGRRLKSVSRQRFLELGTSARLFRLEPRRDEPPDDKQSESSKTQGDGREAAPEILGMGAFSQLADAAQRCGLVPNSDQIAHVRDREFRLGKYQLASQTIEGLYGKFIAAATQRAQRLRREDVDIASGRTKMSPKELLAKRARDTAETQNIERARTYFMRVLEGLRILMAD